MIIINLIHNVLILLGTIYLGKSVAKKITLDINLGNKLHFDVVYSLIGFSIISLYIFAITLTKIFIFENLILINILLVFLALKYLKSWVKKLNIKINKNHFFFLLFLIILATCTLAPPTDADSLSYHLSIPKKIIDNNEIIYHQLNYHQIFYGPGEAMFLIGLIFGNDQLPQFLNFISILSIMMILSGVAKIKLTNNQNFIYLIPFISIPVLFLFLSLSKPQIFFSALNLLIFFIIITTNWNKVLLKEKLSFFFLIIFFLITSVLSKITFITSSIILIIYFIIKNKDILKSKRLFFYLFISILFLAVIYLLKYKIYGIHAFYFVPSYFLEFDNNFNLFLKSLRNANLEFFFPINIFIPIKLTNLFNNIGYISILVIINIFFTKSFNLEKKIILFLILIQIVLDINSARFYIDVYLFCILIFLLDKKNVNKKKFNKIFILSIPQLLLTSLIVFYQLISLGNMSLDKSYENYLKKNAFGYEMHAFINSLFTKKKIILSTHRSTYYTNHDIYYLETIRFGELNNAQKKNIEKINPNILIETQPSNYFEKCKLKLLSQSIMYNNQNRNPFKKSSKSKINIYLLKNIKNSKCLSKKNN